MSIQNIHLRKLIKIIYLDERRRTSALRSDIRDDIAREAGGGGAGGDFYGPFWRDAKDHVFNTTDLQDQTQTRINDNPRRARLYPLLRDGFLLWWEERRRWTNEPFRPAPALRSTCRLPRVDATLKIANILAVRDGRDEDHFVYPYWFDEPPLNDESARLMLWALSVAFPNVDQDEFRILDVIRGETYSIERNALQGNEGTIFARRFNATLEQWRLLREEY